MKQKNFSAEEKKAIKTLLNDKSIIIKPADKGGAVVIQDTIDYIGEAKRRLTNENYYKKVTEDLTENHNAQINKYIEGIHTAGEISSKVRKRLIGGLRKTLQLYLLPKIHKGGSPPPGGLSELLCD